MERFSVGYSVVHIERDFIDRCVQSTPWKIQQTHYTKLVWWTSLIKIQDCCTKPCRNSAKNDWWVNRWLLQLEQRAAQTKFSTIRHLFVLGGKATHSLYFLTLSNGHLSNTKTASKLRPNIGCLDSKEFVSFCGFSQKRTDGARQRYNTNAK